MGPGFYCPTCQHNPDNDKYRDVANGCPRCPLTQTYTQISISNADTLIKRQGGYPAGFDADSLNAAYSIVSRILAENKDRLDGRWSVTFAECCRIIQQERAQAKYERDYAHYLKMKAMAKS